MQFGQLKRREFIAVLAGAAAWPLAVRAQQPRRQLIVGFMGSTTAAAGGPLIAAFVARLRELGWIEGRNVGIEYRWAEGRSERYAEIVAEFVRLNVDVILTHNTPTVLAAKQATTTIPIVFATAGDPVGSGLVASLARPGGNVTGLSSQTSDTAGKRLELLREVVPNLRRFAILANVGSSFPLLDAREAEAAGRMLGMEGTLFDIRGAQDITAAFDALKGRYEALYVGADPLVTANQIRINTLALGARLPSIHEVRELVATGGLMSYGSNWPSQFRRAADYVDKILRGTKPSDIPVEQPVKFDLVINLITAKAIGLTVPPILLARADEVIE